MRILMVAATYPPTRCGVGDYVRRLGRELQQQGAEIFVLTGSADGEDHEHAKTLEQHRVEAPPPISAVQAPGFILQPDGIQLARAVESWDWGARAVVAAALEAVRPDLLSLQYHGEDYLLHPAVCDFPALAHRQGVGLVTTLHNLQQPRSFEGGPDPLARLLEESDAWISTNLLDEGRLRALPGAPQKLSVISAGPCITTVGERVSRGPDTGFELAYFGFLNPFKGIEYLLRAVSLLRDEGRPPGLRLAAGLHTDAPERLRSYAAFIDSEIERLGLGSLLVRSGYVSDEEISEMLLRCDLVVFPFRDGLSGKNSSFWSALHHGSPTLTTRGPGLPEVLRHRHNVLLAGIDDARSLAEQIRWAMDHPVQLRELGEEGRRTVQAEFSWEMLAGRTLSVFGATCAGGSTSGASAGGEGARS